MNFQTGIYDARTLRRNSTSGNLEYSIDGSNFSDDLDSATPGVQSLAALAVNSIDVDMNGGDDTLIIDFATGGEFAPSSGMTCDGRPLGNDTLQVIGNGSAVGIYRPSATTNGNGQIKLFTSQRTTQVDFIDLEPVEVSGMSQLPHLLASWYFEQMHGLECRRTAVNRFSKPLFKSKICSAGCQWNR